MSIVDLSTQQVSELSKHLKSMATELRSQLEEFRQNTDPVTLDQQSVGRVSRIDAIQQQQMAIANRDQAELLLKRVSGALRRVESDEYGFCLQCGEAISFARLQAQPHAPHCLDCQSALEQK